MKKVLKIFLALAILILLAIWFFSPQPRPKIKSYNILYLTSDSFNKKHIPFYGYNSNTMPFLSTLAPHAAVFDRMINPSGWTNENLISLFSGLYSAVHKVETRGRNIDPNWTTPIEILKGYGYRIPRLEGWQGDQNHEKLGFDTVEIMHPAEWLTRHGKEGPFFLFHQFLQPHLPYNGYNQDSEIFFRFYSDTLYSDNASRQRIYNTVYTTYLIPRDGSIKFETTDIPAIHALYDGELLLLDREIERTIKTLKELGLFENTIIIIGADHGEELMEHGFVGHASTSRNGTLYDEIVNVPFLIYFPKEIAEGRFIKTQVRGVDVMPTVMDFLGLPVPDYLEGKSLMPVIRGEETKDRIAFIQTSRAGYGEPDPQNVTDRIRAVIYEGWKLIHYFYKENQGRFELYNLRDDPLEQKNILDEEPKKANELREILFKWVNDESKKKPLQKDPFDYSSPYQKLMRWLFPRKPIDLTGVPSPPVLLSPKDGSVVTAKTDGGRVVFKWTGRADVPYVIEYDVGKDTTHLHGYIELEGNEKIYGPFEKSYWNTYLRLYSPYRVRISIDKEPREWSEWVKIEVAASN